MQGAAQPSPAQSQFDFIIGISNRELLRVDEVARRLAVERDYVYALIAEGVLEVHRRKGQGVNTTQLITKRSVLLWLAASAQYTSTDTINLLEDYAKKLSRKERLELLKRLQALPLPPA